MRFAEEASVRTRWTTVAVALVLATAPLWAQVATPTTGTSARLTPTQIGLFVYPAKGQSTEQQRKDESACFEWAEVSTGLTLVPGQVDTDAARRAGTSGTGQGKVVGEAATGAATGLAIGAIAGNAGRGAAIGAVAGSVSGLRGRRSSRRAAGQQAAQEAVQTNQQSVDQVKRAAAACLEARGYTVR